MELDGVLSALLSGTVIGLLGRLLAPSSGRIGCLLTILLGIAGGLIGLWAATELDADGWALTLLLQVIAAALLVSIFAALARPRRKGP